MVASSALACVPYGDGVVALGAWADSGHGGPECLAFWELVLCLHALMVVFLLALVEPGYVEVTADWLC